MKFALLISVAMMTVSVMAADANPKFNENKTKMLERLDAEIKILEGVKTCVQGAADMEVVKKCHETAKAEREKLNKERIDNKIKNLEEKKKALEEKKAK